MAKLAALLMIFLFCSTLTYAARPSPALAEEAPSLHGDAVEAGHAEELGYQNCKGLGEDECLTRNAHIDYIYTQKNNP